MPYIRNTVTGQTTWHDPKENYVLKPNEIDIGNSYIPLTPQQIATISTLSLKDQAGLIINRKTMERIQRAVIGGRTTWASADVVAYCAFLDKCQAIYTGKDKTSTVLPTEPPFPAGT